MLGEEARRPEGSANVQRAVVRHHRSRLHRDPAHGTADRCADLGCARRCRTVLNVGAGTGSYEPPGRHVLAVEPSALMRSQRLPDGAPCLAGSAENLPFADQSFDAAMAVCTVHHWQDPIAGLREMRRVARRVVVFAGDTSDPGQFWLTRDYLPEFAALRPCRVLASLTGLARAGRRAEGSAQPPQ
jgi:SAM-dependent methyltransferase